MSKHISISQPLIKKGAMNVKESKEWYMEGFEGQKMKVKYIIM